MLGQTRDVGITPDTPGHNTQVSHFPTLSHVPGLASNQPSCILVNNTLVRILVIHNSGFSFLLVNITVLECYISFLIHGIVIIVTVESLKALKRADHNFTESFRKNIVIQYFCLVFCLRGKLTSFWNWHCLLLKGETHVTNTIIITKASLFWISRRPSLSVAALAVWVLVCFGIWDLATRQIPATARTGW